MALFLLVTATIFNVLLLSTFVLPYLLSPDFTSSPADVTVTYGDTATFTCSIPSSFDRDVYWGKKNTSSVVYDFISVEETITDENLDRNKFNVTRTDTPSNRIYTLRIMSVTSADSASYFCAMLVPKNNNTNFYEMSSYALLTVTEPDLPSFECFTTPERANVGDEVTFNCLFNKSQPLSLELTWNRNPNHTQVIGNTDVDSVFGGTGRVFPRQAFSVTWTMKETDNYETFECYVEEKLVCVTTPLQVNLSPSVLQLPDQHNLILGSNASFYCKTTINYPPVKHYFWNVTSGSLGTYYLLNSTTERFGIVDEGKVIVITNLTESDNESKLSCTVITTTGMSYTSQVVNINVLRHRQNPDYAEFNLLIFVVSLPSATLLIILVLGCVIQQKCKMTDWTVMHIKSLDVRKAQTQEITAVEGQSSELGKPEQAIPMVEQKLEGPENSGTAEKRYSEPKYAIPAPVSTASPTRVTDVLVSPRYANTPRNTMDRGLSAYTDAAGYVHPSPVSASQPMDVSDSNV